MRYTNVKLKNLRIDEVGTWLDNNGETMEKGLVWMEKTTSNRVYTRFEPKDNI